MSLTKTFKTIFLIALLVVISMFVWKYFYKIQEVVASAPPNSPAEEKPNGFGKVYHVRSKVSVARDVEIKEEYAGTTEPYREANIGAQISGRIKKIHVREGDFVRQGDVLFTLYDDDRTNKLMAARAEMNLRKMQYAAAQNLEAKNLHRPFLLQTPIII